MKIIGITGGVGAGKSKVLSFIEENYKARIIRADEAAHMLEKPGHECYDKLVSLLGEGVLSEDGTINKLKMAEIIFSDKDVLAKVNGIIHPEVKRYIIEEIKREKEEGKLDYFFIEAALLIEERYDLIVDELWYIYASEEVRRQRLKETRNYSEEKITSIMRGQLSEEEFRKACKHVILNNGDLEETYSQIKKCLGEENDGNECGEQETCIRS